ncbi:hypothetical protein OIU76_027903 [Salix suchowensis]|nr:hypothetical protein OIU76_027903 [Salix suchowensis]
MPPLTSLHLRHLLRHYHLSSPPPPTTFSLCFTPTYLPKTPALPFRLSQRPFSSSQTLNPNTESPDPAIAQSLSTEISRDPNTDPLSISERLQLSFSHLTKNNALTPSLVLQTLKLSPDAGRTVIGFHHWLIKDSNFEQSDESLAIFVDYFGRRKDFKASHDLLVEGKSVAGVKCFESMIDRLVRAGRTTQKLCENGYASYAEKMVKNLADEIFPDDGICDLLIKGWCVDGKLEEAKKISREMYRGGFEIGTMAFNAMLDCVCKLCRGEGSF